MDKRVGFIGLGAMGFPMAANIAKAGIRLIVFDTEGAKSSSLKQYYPGIEIASCIKEVGNNSDIVITMLPDAKTVETVCIGENGLFSSMKAGSVWIDMTTGDPFTTERLVSIASDSGIHSLDAPCGRSPKHAQAGDLLVLIGGDESVLDEVRSVLSCMASDIIRCGNNGAGHTMKLINNLLSGVIQEANIEAISLGMKAGISVSTMLKVFSEVCVWNGYLAGLPYEDEAAPGWKVTTAEEHMELIQKLGKKYHVPVYTTAVVRERMEEMIAQGKGDSKYSNIKTLLKNMAGLEINEEIIDPVRNKNRLWGGIKYEQ